MRRATQNPIKAFGIPEGESWETATPANLATAFADREVVLVASWDGWKRAKIYGLRLVDSGRKVAGVTIEMESGGLLDINEPGMIRGSILVRPGSESRTRGKAKQ